MFNLNSLHSCCGSFPYSVTGDDYSDLSVISNPQIRMYITKEALTSK